MIGTLELLPLKETAPAREAWLGSYHTRFETADHRGGFPQVPSIASVQCGNWD